MSDAPPAPQDAQTAGPPGRGLSRSATLLSLLACLLDCGRTLLAELRQRDPDDVSPALAYRFGPVSLALIIARVTRGIMLVTALRDRVTRNARRLDAPHPPTRTRAAPPDRPAPPDRARPAPPDRPERRPVDEAAELHNLPSAQDIADRIRRRPIGIVIEEICRDFGISGIDELWRAVLDAITVNGGSRARVLRIGSDRAFAAFESGIEVPPLPPSSVRTMTQALFDPPDFVMPSEDELMRAMAMLEPPALATPPP